MSLACDCLLCRAANGEFDSSLQQRACSPARWLVVRIEDEPVRVVEVRDVMECIHGPGDYGWVTPVDDAVRFPPGGCIANFEQLYATKAAAVGARVAELRAGIAERLAELERWGVQENDEAHPLTGDKTQ